MDAFDTIPTRESLLSRIRDLGDNDSWRQFFETYWRLIYRTALSQGLTEAEAQDVVQETVICVMKSIPSFRYDRHKGSFKTWLLHLTAWRISDILRKRNRQMQLVNQLDVLAQADASGQLPNLVNPEIEARWNDEWEQNLMDRAVDRVKRRISARQYQAFDCYVLKRWPLARVSEALGVNQAYVYLAKHRVTRMLKQEADHLQSTPL